MNERGSLFVPHYGEEMEHVCDVKDMLLSKVSGWATFLDSSEKPHGKEYASSGQQSYSLS